MSKPCSASTSPGTASSRALADSRKELQHMGDKAVPDLDMSAAVVALLLMARECCACITAQPEQAGALRLVILAGLVWAGG